MIILISLSLICNTLFSLLAGENINATGVSGAEISVIWDQPTYLYINFNDVSGSSQLLEGNM